MAAMLRAQRSRSPWPWTIGDSMDTEAARKLRRHLVENCLKNHSSASNMHQLASLAGDAGASGVHGLAKLGNHGKACKNLSRDIMRFAKNVMTNMDEDVPEPYYVTIPIKCPKTSVQTFVEHPMLLPHELISWLLTTGRCHLADLTEFTRSDNYLNKYHKEFCDTHGLDLHSTIPLGFHGDGAPFQKSHHKQSSTEVYSWNFLVDRNGKRYLCTNINKDFMVHHNQETAYKLLEVFKWSMIVMLHGHWPTKRHDGTPYQDGDNSRTGRAGSPLGFHGVLLQARGGLVLVPSYLQVPTMELQAHLLEMQVHSQCW